MSHRPFLQSAIQVVGDFRIGDFDRHSYRLDPNSMTRNFKAKL